MKRTATRARRDPDAPSFLERRKLGWRRLLSWLSLRRFGLSLLGLVILAFSFFGIVSLYKGEPWGPFIESATTHCDGSGFGCSIVTQFLFTWAALAFGFGVFILARYSRLRRSYIRQARKEPAELVETARNIVGKVVGRDALCDILQEDLQDRRTRQPHVLVGGLGIGKTAVLVRLTKLLATRGAVPVPVRLRNAQGKIDFLDLARSRFLEVMGSQLRSNAEADRVWRELRRDDRIVVLADGLEEAFADEKSRHDRNHRVRVAVREATSQRFPLIIASRPHEALRDLGAALVHLEPLSEEVALEYIEGDELNLEDPRLDWVVETAQVTETPLYLRLAQELHAEGLLEHHSVDTRGADRVPLRLRLMRAWVDALIEGKLRDTEDVPLAPHHRAATIAHLEALACVGLRHDTQQIIFEKYGQPAPRRAGARPQKQPSADAPERDIDEGEVWCPDESQQDARDEIEKQLVDRLAERVKGQLGALKGADGLPAKEVYDLEAAGSRGVQLKIVDHLANGVRFPHSIMQAYLGSRVLDKALTSRDNYAFLCALRDPGRELLLSLVMYARADDGKDDDRDHEAAKERSELSGVILKRLGGVISQVDESKRLDVIATAIEIAMGIELGKREYPKDHRADVGEYDLLFTANLLVKEWDKIRAADDAAQAAKLNAIARLGDAARLAGATTSEDGKGLYACLYSICLKEDLYRIRLAAAQQIGNGKERAWEQVRSAFCSPEVEAGWRDQWTWILRPDHGERTAEEPADAPPATESTGAPPATEPTAAPPATEPDRNVPKPDAPERGPIPADEWGDHTERRYALQGWILPMLVGSIEGRSARQEAEKRLQSWIAVVGDEGQMPLALEACLAQGFKHAANRRPHHSQENAESRARLKHHAATMIHRAEFWYSRIALLHALCLWELSQAQFPNPAGHGSSDFSHQPVALVERWLRRSGGKREPAQEKSEEHPFVRQAADLVVDALVKEKPESYIWIDESGVVGTVGSTATTRRAHSRRSLWIAPSAGWIALDRRAMQLVADVQVLLNLAERGDATGREGRLRATNRGDLPLCLTRERCAHLKPSQTVGMADTPDPGDDCKRGCPVELCPYPPRGQQPYRVELSEAFCRHQSHSLRGLGRRAPWQEATRSELRRFWAEMENRARK